MSSELVLITGMSGSGKSVALHALEDLGFYCVDNLPPELLLSFVDLENKLKTEKVAIAMDVRSRGALHLVPAQLAQLRQRNINIRLLFLECNTDTLVHRYSETRRRHPLSQFGQGGDALSMSQTTTTESGESETQKGPSLRNLSESIELERELLADLREMSHIIDTSLLKRSKLQSYIHSLIGAPAAALTLMFESFAFKRGVPSDADFMFDVRMLPNPHYTSALKNLTGMDQPVIDFLSEQADVQRMLRQIIRFLDSWLPDLSRDNRSYVTVAIGCTGGQHRSVYLVEQLVRRFSTHWATLKRHREMDART